MYQDYQYWGRPVVGFGDHQAKVLILGLAPGAHGSNRTGRMFTGDASGDFLYPALYKAGFANQPGSIDCNDDLELNKVFISSLCRCVPPQNKPEIQEIKNCQPFLWEEINLLQNLCGIVALGQIAFGQAIKIITARYQTHYLTQPFRHGSFISPNDRKYPWILASYHPSRQNTQTGRLTVDMFDEIWQRTNDLINS